MHTLPTLEDVKKIVKSGDYSVVPVSLEILSDFITPIEAVKILKKASKHCFMLESAVADETWGRYTFLGYEPKLSIDCVGGVLKESREIGDVTLKCKNPSDYLRDILKEYKSPRLDYLPTFTGGLVGYFSYDYITYSEPTVTSGKRDEEAFKDVDLMLFDKVICFDNIKQKIILIANMKLDNIEENYEKAKHSLKEMLDLLKNGEKDTNTKGKLTGAV
ncbi:MAG: anthranilate synthase component I, partial [Lachnospiraceae bacterium]|nr:anthranilate synthase component I [Lachnospiraceae bacterium]